jgi:hypothetical protein
MATVTRSFSTPQELYFRVERVCKKLGITFTKAHNEAFELWLKEEEKRNGTGNNK